VKALSGKLERSLLSALKEVSLRLYSNSDIIEYVVSSLYCEEAKLKDLDRRETFLGTLLNHPFRPHMLARNRATGRRQKQVANGRAYVQTLLGRKIVTLTIHITRCLEAKCLKLCIKHSFVVKIKVNLR